MDISRRIALDYAWLLRESRYVGGDLLREALRGAGRRGRSAFFVTTLSPVLGLSSLHISLHVVADHYQYFGEPSVNCVSFCRCWPRWLDILKESPSDFECGGVSCCTLAVLTWRQAAMYGDMKRCGERRGRI